MLSSTPRPGETLMAERKEPVGALVNSDGKAIAVAKVNYTHDAMIDFILMNPTVTQGQLAKQFGYTQGWVCRVMSSDAFKERLAKRKGELVDPIIAQSVEEKLTAVVSRAADIILDKLDATPDANLAIKAIDVAARAAGFGAKQGGVQVNTQFVVHMPTKSTDAASWREECAPKPAIEVQSE